MGHAIDSAADVFPLTETDRYVLSLTDAEYVPHDWDDLTKIVATNNLSILRRRPSDLRRYMKWTADTKARYGSTMRYLIVHRLPKAWGSPPYVPASTLPFANPCDYCVLTNDWPYGVAPGITHLVVWSRTLIETDPDTGDMTPTSRAQIGAFVQRYFVDDLESDSDSDDGGDGKDRVLWFKNWAGLQSVRQLEHIHVLVRNVSSARLTRWTRELPCHQAGTDHGAATQRAC